MTSERPDGLAKQLEKSRFDRALAVSDSLAAHRALLTTAELARMNSIMTGRKDDEDAWRREPATIRLPSGKVETLAVITDPVFLMREKLHRATEMAENGHIIDAAIDVYVNLVLAHAFKDANRRTAVLAGNYFLRRYGIPLSGTAIHELGLGDLRDPAQIELLRETVHHMAKFVKRRN